MTHLFIVYLITYTSKAPRKALNRNNFKEKTVNRKHMNPHAPSGNYTDRI